jgi:hypothetical protein
MIYPYDALNVTLTQPQSCNVPPALKAVLIIQEVVEGKVPFPPFTSPRTI